MASTAPNDTLIAFPSAVPEPPSEDERRFSERHFFRGAEVFLFVDDKNHYRLSIKDLSSHGISGLTDVPLKPGELVIVQLEESLMPTAEVRWTKLSMMGLRFLNPLPVARFRRLCQRQGSGARWSPAMRSGTGKGGWQP